MRQIIRDILRSRHSDEQEMETPEYVRRLASFHMSCTLHVRLNYTELFKEYQVFHRTLLSADRKALDIANIAVLFGQSDCITFVLPRNYILNHSECNCLVRDLLTTSRMALSVAIQFEWPSFIPYSVSSYFERRHYLTQIARADVAVNFATNSILFDVQNDGVREDSDVMLRILNLEKLLSQDAANSTQTNQSKHKSGKSAINSNNLLRSGVSYQRTISKYHHQVHHCRHSAPFHDGSVSQ